MPRRARIEYVSLKSSLVNLPISIYGPLVEHSVRPQGLAVHLSLVSSSRTTTANANANNANEKTEAYVGWTGMTSASSLARFKSSSTSGPGSEGLETVEIDPQFASALGFGLGDVVEIGLIHDLKPATSVGTEPLTSDDWEILELHASYVEQNLLAQVRVACVGQEVDVWVLGRTRVRLRVVSLTPAPPPNAKKAAALLLTTDTEVTIAPKVRGGSSASTKAKGGGTTNASGKGAGGGEKGGEEKVRKKRATLRVLPRRMFDFGVQRKGKGKEVSNAKEGGDDGAVNAAAAEGQIEDEERGDEFEEPTPIAWVSRTSFCNLTALRFPCPPADSPEIQEWRVVVKRLGGPVSPSSAQSQGSTTQEKKKGAEDQADGTRVIHSSESQARGGDAGKEGGGEEREEERVVLSWSRGVPEGQVVFDLGSGDRKGSSGNAVGFGDVQNWDMVYLIADGPSPRPKKRRRYNEPSFIVHDPPPKSGGGELAGIDELLEKAVRHCAITFMSHGLFNRGRRLTPIWGALFLGRPGAGKTAVAKAVAKSLEDKPSTMAHTIYVDASKHAEERVPQLHELFKYWYAKASWHKPSVLVLDNLDKVLGVEVEHAESFRARQLAHLFMAVFAGDMINAKHMVLLVTAQSDTALHNVVRTGHIFMDTFKVNPPTRTGRKDILTQAVQKKMSSAPGLVEDTDKPPSYTALATTTEGYSAADLIDLVSRALHQAAIRAVKKRSMQDGGGQRINEEENLSTVLTHEDFVTAQEDFVPLSLRDVKLQKSDVKWADIGGLKETKEVLRETLEWPTKYAAIFAKCPLRLRSGLMLYGYPGCGKTLLASAVAKECGLNFISVKGPELLNKYIGASEKSVRDIFDRAQAAKPCVLFFDEFDSIAPKRGHDSTGVTDRVVNQMLTQMDGAEGLDGVYVLAATSRPDLIDSALLRPGRLDKSLLCPMPNEQDRKEILEIVANKVNLSPFVDLAEYAKRTEGYSGADLQALIYNANLEVIHESIASKAKRSTEGEGGKSEPDIEYFAIGGGADSERKKTRAEEADFQRRLKTIFSGQDRARAQKTAASTAPAPPTKKPEISDKHLQRSLESTRPSVPRDEQERLSRIYRAFMSDRSGKQPVPSEERNVGSRVSLM